MLVEETFRGTLGIAPEELGLAVDTSSFVPFYQQIFAHIRTLIKNGKLREGEVFCSEGDLARSLQVSKMPVRHAFQKLRSEGLLIIAKGKRPVVGSPRVLWNFQQLRGFTEEMKRRGLSTSAQLLSMELLQPDLEVAQALRLAPEEKVYRVKRLRFLSDEPVALVTSCLPARIFLGIDKHDLENQSLYYVVEKIYRRKLQRAEEVIGAVNADADIAGILQTSVGSPLLSIRETAFDSQNIGIEYSLSLLRADRYTASVVSVRHP